MRIHSSAWASSSAGGAGRSTGLGSKPQTGHFEFCEPKKMFLSSKMFWCIDLNNFLAWLNVCSTLGLECVRLNVGKCCRFGGSSILHTVAEIEICEMAALAARHGTRPTLRDNPNNLINSNYSNFGKIQRCLNWKSKIWTPAFELIIYLYSTP